MKICFVTTGDITTLATMKRATGMGTPLVEAGNEVAIIALDCENNRQRFTLECPDVIPLFFSASNWMDEVRQKKKIIEIWNPDIIYVCSFGFRNWIHHYNVNGKKIVLVEHSELASAIPNNKKKLFYLVVEYLSIILFDGQLLASRYLESVFIKRIHRIRNRVPILYFPYAYNKKTMNISSDLYLSLCNEYSNKKIMLYMGTLSINYGFLDILRAARKLKKDRHDFVFFIIGKGKHEGIGRTFILENKLEDVVKMLGYVSEEELSSYFKLATVFIAPLNNSIQDKARCPSKLFMYLPFRKPIITCKIGESWELFGDSGYYYESGDIDQLSDAIKSAIEKAPSSINVNPSEHTWELRTQEFLSWVQREFTLN